MARRIESIQVTLVAKRDDAGNLVQSVGGIIFEVSDPAGPRDFDKKPVVSNDLPGFALDPTKLRAVMNDIVAAVKTEASVP